MMRTLRNALIFIFLICSGIALHAVNSCDFPYDSYLGYAPKEFCHNNTMGSIYPFENASAYLAYNSKFLWRGLNLSNGSVLQPAISFTQYNFSSIVWGNLDLSEDNRNSGNFTRVDIVLDYSNTLKCADCLVGYSAGLIHYVYPSTEDCNTTEMYVAATMNGTVAPTLTFFYDIDEVCGWYMNLLLKSEWGTLFCPTLCSVVTIETSLSLGWGNSNYNRYYYGLKSARFLDFYANLSFPTLYKKWYLAPHLSYSYLVDASIRDANINENANLWGGLTVLRLF
jgi:hypothetical protein